MRYSHGEEKKKLLLILMHALIISGFAAAIICLALPHEIEVATKSPAGA